MGESKLIDRLLNRGRKPASSESIREWGDKTFGAIIMSFDKTVENARKFQDDLKKMQEDATRDLQTVIAGARSDAAETLSRALHVALDGEIADFHSEVQSDVAVAREKLNLMRDQLGVVATAFEGRLADFAAEVEAMGARLAAHSAANLVCDCGRINLPGSAFCDWCGRPLREDAGPPATRQP